MPPPGNPFNDRVDPILARYVRGEIEFEAAADELAGVLRDLMSRSTTSSSRPRGPLRLKTLSPKEWMSADAIDSTVGGVLQARPFVPGVSREDEDKARALFAEAVRRAERSSGDAA
jgi:hypothetical protein